MSDPDEPLSTELDLARMGLPPDTDVEGLCRRVTDVLMAACAAGSETPVDREELRLVDAPTPLEAARLGL
jgi:hypothetical protein